MKVTSASTGSLVKCPAVPPAKNLPQSMHLNAMHQKGRIHSELDAAGGTVVWDPGTLESPAIENTVYPFSRGHARTQYLLNQCSMAVDGFPAGILQHYRFFTPSMRYPWAITLRDGVDARSWAGRPSWCDVSNTLWYSVGFRPRFRYSVADSVLSRCALVQSGSWNSWQR